MSNSPCRNLLTIFGVLILFGAGCAKESESPTQAQPTAATSVPSDIGVTANQNAGSCPITSDLVKRFCNISSNVVVDTALQDDPGCEASMNAPSRSEGLVYVLYAIREPLSALQQRHATISMYEYLDADAIRIIASDPSVCFRPSRYRVEGLGDDAAAGDAVHFGPSTSCPRCECPEPARSIADIEGAYALAVAYGDQYLYLSGTEYEDLSSGCTLTEAKALARYLIGQTTELPEMPKPAPSPATPSLTSPCILTPNLIKEHCNIKPNNIPMFSRVYDQECEVNARDVSGFAVAGFREISIERFEQGRTGNVVAVSGLADAAYIKDTLTGFELYFRKGSRAGVFKAYGEKGQEEMYIFDVPTQKQMPLGGACNKIEAAEIVSSVLLPYLQNR